MLLFLTHVLALCSAQCLLNLDEPISTIFFEAGPIILVVAGFSKQTTQKGCDLNRQQPACVFGWQIIINIITIIINIIIIFISEPGKIIVFKHVYFKMKSRNV